MGGQAAVCHQRVAAIKRGDPAPHYVGGKQQLLTMELLDEIREFIEEEHGRISVRTVALRFTLSRSSSRRALSMLRLCPLVIRTVLLLEDRHIRDRRFAEEVLANLALASGRQLDLDVICLRDEEIFRVDAVAPEVTIPHFRRKWANVSIGLPFRDTPRENGGSIVASAHI